MWHVLGTSKAIPDSVCRPTIGTPRVAHHGLVCHHVTFAVNVLSGCALISSSEKVWLVPSTGKRQRPLSEFGSSCACATACAQTGPDRGERRIRGQLQGEILQQAGADQLRGRGDGAGRRVQRIKRHGTEFGDRLEAKPAPHRLQGRGTEAYNPGETLLPMSSPVQDDSPATTVRAAVLDLLRAFGMTSIFGNPGSTELPLFREFPKDFRYVLGLQEAVVVGMADGYAQATRNAAFINLHSAAGVGHAMGNIFTAYRNRTPLVITAGQQARSILPYDPFLYSNQATELPKPYVKWSCEPARAEDVPLAIARAYYVAMQPPRGPVLVSIPADDWARNCEPVAARMVSTEIRPEPRVLQAIGEALDESSRPAFVVGAAVDRDGAWDDVVRLAERHNAAVWVAPMSGRCSFPEDHALFAGFLPPMREKIVDLLAAHDVIAALGAAAFTYHVEGAGPHLPAGARLVQLIDDPQIAAWTPQGTSAVGSIRLGVLDLARAATAAHT